MISGERIVLRAWERSDLETFTRWFNDPEITISWGNAFPALSLAQQERFYESTLEEKHRYSIVTKDDPILIGNCAFDSIDSRNRSAEVGLLIGEKAYWDQGYGQEALALLLEIGFEGMGSASHLSPARGLEQARASLLSGRRIQGRGTPAAGHLHQRRVPRRCAHVRSGRGVLHSQARVTPRLRCLTFQPPVLDFSPISTYQQGRTDRGETPQCWVVAGMSRLDLAASRPRAAVVLGPGAPCEGFPGA